MVMSFMWLPGRVDPASWSPRPGATAYVTAAVDGEYMRPVTLTADADLVLDPLTPAAQAVKPIRATLEELLASLRKGLDPANCGFRISDFGLTENGKSPAAANAGLVKDLEDYLRGRIPPQNVAWTIRTPEDRAGRFAVTVAAEGAEAVQTYLVLGDRYPPQVREDTGDGKGPVQTARPQGAQSPIQLVKVKYVEAKTQGGDVFWAPLSFLGRPDWDAGWLSLYLVVYLPIMFICRWLLRVA
jgi:hypothetical protein